jgi:hypothetical protein
MRKLLSFLICLLLAIGTQAQVNKCKKVRKGVFKLVTPGHGTMVVTRTPTKQIESNDSTGYKASFDMVWNDNCSYILRNRKILSGNSRSEWKLNYEIKIDILEVTDTTYKAHFSCNFSNYATDFQLEIVE